MPDKPRAIRAALIVCAIALLAAALTLLLPFAGASVIRAWFGALSASEQKTEDTALRMLGPAVSGLSLILSVLIHWRRRAERKR